MPVLKFYTSYLSIVVVFILSFILFYKRKHNYWKKRNIPCLQPTFPFGNIPNPFSVKEKPGQIINRIYNKIKRKGWKHGGFYFFTSPIYLPVDLKYVKNILVKDFDYFVDRGFYYNEKDDPIGANLFFLGGSKWKHIRAQINPAFTGSKIKMMTPIILHSADNLFKKFEIEYNTNHTISINELFTSYTIEVIGSCAFGLDCNVLENKDVQFKHYGLKSIHLSKSKLIIQMVAAMIPSIAKRVGLKIIPKDVANFFTSVVKETVSFRQQNNYTRKDFMQVMIEMKKTMETNNVITEKVITEIVAHCLVFFVAGFETSASTMIFALYELSKNEDVQDKVRNEIWDVVGKHNHQVDYDKLSELTYLQQVLDETLRIHPPLLYVTRRCIRNYKLPDEDAIIEKGTMIIIPIQAIHLDEEYYRDPYIFDPERFNEENKMSRHKYTHIPFGEGPRICIGKRVGAMQTKIGLVYLLQKYKFLLNERTKEPIELKLDSLVAGPKTSIWLDVQKI